MSKRFSVVLGGAAGLSILIGLTPAAAAVAKVTDTAKEPPVKIIGTPGRPAAIKARQGTPVMPPKTPKPEKPADLQMVAPPAIAKPDSSHHAKSTKDTTRAASKVKSKSPSKKSDAKKPAR